MNKTYKITSSLVTKIAYRDVRKKAFLIFGVLLVFFLLMTYRNNKNGLNNDSTYFATIFGAILFGLVLINVIRFKKLFYSNYEIIIDDEGIHKLIEVDDTQSIGFINSYLWSRAKRVYPQNNISLKWEEILSMNENNYGLYLKTETADSFRSSGQIFIPKEIEHYAEIKKIAENKINIRASNI